jgi:hypothetical protein
VKKLFGLLAAGVLLASPAFAQKVTVTATPASAKAGDTVNVCASADNDVKGVASWGLTFTLPAGLTVANDGKFTNGPLTANQLTVPNATVAGQYKVGVIGTSDANGPGQIGCFDVTVGDATQTGDISVAVEASNANGDAVNIGSTGATLTIQGGTTPPPPTGSGVTVSVTPATVDASGTAKVCADASADVTGVASWGLTFTLPAGFTVANDGKFTNGPLTANQLTVPNATVPGQYKVGVIGTADANGPGQIGCFDIVAGTGAQTGAIGITVEASNANGDAVTVAGTGATVTVNGGTTPPPPTKGDVDGNGKVDVTDVHAAISVLFGVDTDAAHKTAADFNGDGTVDLRDVRLLLQAVVAGG